MNSAELAALITACGVSIAGILTAIAALRNSMYSAQRVKDLEGDVARLKQENEDLRATAAQNAEHTEAQDRVILDQQVKIGKWHAWGQSMGRAFNVMQLEYGALLSKPAGHDRKATGPLPE